MKKLFWVSLFVLLLSALAVTAVFADNPSGEMCKLYNGGVIIDNTWEYDESTKTLYIRSNSTENYNETGKLGYTVSEEDTKNGYTGTDWTAYKAEIEHVVLEGRFDKCSGGAFANHIALKDIRITSDVNQFDGQCFYGCTNLESVTVGDNEHVVGLADLSNASVFRGTKHFYGTKIDTAFILGNPEVAPGPGVEPEAAAQFNAGTTVYAQNGTTPYEYFSGAEDSEGNNLYTVIDNSPVTISVTVDGEVFTNTYPYGTELAFPTFDGDCVTLYYDEQLTQPYQYNVAKESISLFGKPLLDYVGPMVRIEEYQGLRMIYKVDKSALGSLSGYEIKEFGSISMKQVGVGKKLSLDSENISKVTVYSDGKYVGKVLSLPTNGVTEFAFTAVGFEKDGVLSVENAEQNLFFRGYIILKDPATGKEYIGYTEQTMMNLADACDKTLKHEDADTTLTTDEKNFVKAPLDAGATVNYVYTKEELKEMLNTVYEDTAHYIPAQHLGTSATSLSNFLDASLEASGSYPALVAFDLIDFTAYNSKIQSIIDECKEYIGLGGVVSFSYHMENPTGNYTNAGLCRGELGGEDAWKELMTDGTALNNRFNVILDYAGFILNEFDKEGYPVIWRPLHENNGSWFWWCAYQSVDGKETLINQEIFIDLWEYVYDYYTNPEGKWGLKNLVWAYSPNVTNTENPKDVMYGYPGSAYCDLVGTDWYTSGKFEVDGDSRSYYTLMNQTNKPVALTEFGPSGSLKANTANGELQIDVFNCEDELNLIKEMMNRDLKLTYVLNWSASWSMLKLGKMDVLMQDEAALDLSEIKGIFDGFFAARNTK